VVFRTFYVAKCTYVGIFDALGLGALVRGFFLEFRHILRKILILLTLSFLNGHYIFAYDGVMSA